MRISSYKGHAYRSYTVTTSVSKYNKNVPSAHISKMSTKLPSSSLGCETILSVLARHVTEKPDSLVQSAANSNVRVVTELTSLDLLTENRNETLTASAIPVGQRGKEETVASNAICCEGVSLQPYAYSAPVTLIGYLLQGVDLLVPALYLGMFLLSRFNLESAEGFSSSSLS